MVAAQGCSVAAAPSWTACAPKGGGGAGGDSTNGEASDAEVERTRYSGRWRHASKLMNLPWEERIKELPRYKPMPGYSPV